MSKFIVETDLGHDPDDFFALCRLITAGHELVAVSVVPGAPEQVKLASFLRERTGQRFLIGVAKKDAKSEKLGVHDKLMDRERAGEGKADGASEDVLRDAFDNHPNSDVLIIGPAVGVGKVITGRTVGRLTFQGGFLPYSLHRPTVTESKFEGAEWIGTFNFNGDRKAVEKIVAADVSRRQFVGKNVCHTVLYNRERHDGLAPARDEASRLFRVCMDLYLEKHDEKKFHDPTALACHLHPEIGTWYAGRPMKREGGWTTEPGADKVLADVDRDRLWRSLLNWE